MGKKKELILRVSEDKKGQQRVTIPKELGVKDGGYVVVRKNG